MRTGQVKGVVSVMANESILEEISFMTESLDMSCPGWIEIAKVG